MQAALTRRALVIGGLMGGVSALGFAFKPGERGSSGAPAIDLAAMVPERFGAWRVDPQVGQAVVNPQTQELLDKLYNQIVTRTYIGPQGERVMLSLAYGGDQRSSLQAHMPEVCYPAQGFKLESLADGTVQTAHGSIPVRRLMTSLGPRKEPITYWFTMGGNTVKTTYDKRIVQLRLALTGQIPDGLLFRLSTLDADPQTGWDAQARFAADLLNEVDATARRRLAGLDQPA